MKPTQNQAELAAFVDAVREAGCSSFLEIGSKCGESLAAVATALVPPSRIVSVDLHKEPGDKARVILDDVLADLSRGHEINLVLGDSTDAKTVEAVRRYAPFDLVFIDANHSTEFVEADWANYGPMGRMVAFHDIADTGMGVAAVWDRLKAEYRHVEIRLDPRGNRNGIGILWRDGLKAQITEYYEASRAHDLAYKQFGAPSAELEAANRRCSVAAWHLRAALGGVRLLPGIKANMTCDEFEAECRSAV